MKSMYNNKLALYATLAVLGVALGCAGGGTQDNSSGTGSGGADAGRICTWDGTGGGVSIPACAGSPDLTVFQGMIDGKPYNETWNSTLASTALPGTKPPYSASISLPAFGHLDVEWG